MAERVLYTLPIPEDADTMNRAQQQRRLSKQGVVGGDPAVTENVSLGPNDLLIQGQYRMQLSEVMANELEELFGATNIQSVPFFTEGSSNTSPSDGYYSMENVTAEPVQAQQGAGPARDMIHRYDGVITRAGRPKSHWRAARATVVQPENDFGSGTTAYVGAPSKASKVQWFNSETKAREAATVAATRNAEFADVDVYDATASSYTDPTLIYEVDYADESPVDCKVWGDRGNASRTDGNSVPQWQWVFDVTHDFVGKEIVANGLVRLTFDEPNNSLSVEEWNNGTSSWDSKSLGSSDWQLYDADIYHIEQSRVEAQVEFEDTTSANFYSFDMILHRGYTWPQWLRPADEGSAPEADLKTLLSGVANDDDRNPQTETTLVPRKDARL